MALREYSELIARHRGLLAFGFLVTLSSSFGQTFFIGVFGASIQAELDLSHIQWGGIYMLGTLASALLLPFTGKLIDDMHLPRYLLLVTLGLAAACWTVASATSAFGLVVAIFLLRQCGQGLMTHVSLTTMARYFERARGRALSLASLGFSVGEALLPFLAVFLIGLIGWRWTYASFGVLLAAVLLPISLGLLKGAGSGEQEPTTGKSAAVSEDDQAIWTRGRVLRDRAFWIMLPGVLAPSVIVTAFFFHHLSIATIKGWSAQWITACYLVYSLMSVASYLLAGNLIDRYGAWRVFPHAMWPLGIAAIVLSVAQSSWLVVPYLAFVGISSGIGQTAGAAVWAEIYGLTHLGGIRALVAAFRVYASAMGPILLGGLLDLGVVLELILVLFAAMAFVGGFCLKLGLKRAAYRRPRVIPQN